MYLSFVVSLLTDFFLVACLSVIGFGFFFFGTAAVRRYVLTSLFPLVADFYQFLSSG